LKQMAIRVLAYETVPRRRILVAKKVDAQLLRRIVEDGHEIDPEVVEGKPTR